MEDCLEARDEAENVVWEFTILLASNQEGSCAGHHNATDLSRDQTPHHVAGIQFVDVI